MQDDPSAEQESKEFVSGSPHEWSGWSRKKGSPRVADAYVKSRAAGADVWASVCADKEAAENPDWSLRSL